MDALNTRARHPDAQLARVSATASLVGWLLVSAGGGVLGCGATTSAPPPAREPVGAVPLFQRAHSGLRGAQLASAADRAALAGLRA